MRHELRTFADADAVAPRRPTFVAQRARDDRSPRRGQLHVRGERRATPWAMFEKLATSDVAWSDVVIYQVDERIAPVGDPTRNLTNLERSLGERRPTIVAMPVNDDDLEPRPRAYADGAARPASTSCTSVSDPTATPRR